MIYTGLINKYRRYLPVSDTTPVVTLNEGNTPLIYAPFLSASLGPGFEVYLKYEGANPTGSFKDRGMTMAISKACEEGVKAVICASTGNTSASAAAYAAKAGIRCIVLIPKGHIALGKLSQALIHGATVLQIDGNFDDALTLVKEITQKYPIKMVNSINPFRIEGQKTASFEVIEALEDAPDFQVMPVGNAGNITAYWKGYKEYHDIGKAKKLPVMLGFQAEGAAPIVRGFPIECPETIVTAIRIGNPASWKQAVAARDESKGQIDFVSDDQILDAYKLLALKEGVFAEPASCASIAGLQKLSHSGYFKKQAAAAGAVKVVCILTGHGLKDPDRAIKSIKPPKTVKPDMKAILAEIGL
ncbi:MAG: threonine synthase [Candidatus Omnitrophica bacterium]|nr:threonine synthase [Candidatus Omnitrophota bacterium]